MGWIRNNFETSHSNHNAILSMEGVRGFAVFLVFIVHYSTQINPWLDTQSITHLVSTQLHRIGNLGVDLFFVLSGYLIYGMLIEKTRPFNKYIIQRIKRIYPAFTCVFIIYLSLSFIFPSESKIPSGLSGLFFIIGNYLLLPGIFDIKAIITVAWSLSYEFFYYLSVPLIITALRMRAWKSVYRLYFITILSISLFLYFSYAQEHIRLIMFLPGIPPILQHWYSSFDFSICHCHYFKHDRHQRSMEIHSSILPILSILF